MSTQTLAWCAMGSFARDRKTSKMTASIRRKYMNIKNVSAD
uniref:Uncharacterized protein n=1 Tax=Anguilla anguilla TaxID=7936 RepID=A0A0E9TAX0_ANGAN